MSFVVCVCGRVWCVWWSPCVLFVVVVVAVCVFGGLFAFSRNKKLRHPAGPEKRQHRRTPPTDPPIVVKSDGKLGSNRENIPFLYLYVDTALEYGVSVLYTRYTGGKKLLKTQSGRETNARRPTKRPFFWGLLYQIGRTYPVPAGILIFILNSM